MKCYINQKIRDMILTALLHRYVDNRILSVLCLLQIKSEEMGELLAQKARVAEEEAALLGRKAADAEEEIKRLRLSVSKVSHAPF